MTPERPDAPARPLFSPAAIAAHTLLFTPAVGGLMAARNWKRLGEVKRARIAAGVGVGGTAALVALAALWPPSWGNAVQGGITGAAVALAVTFYREARPAFEAHLARGGAKAAFWPGTLGGFGLAGAVVAVALAASALSPGHEAFDAGVAALRAGDDAAAERAFRAVLAQAPGDEAAQYDLALALARQGRDAEATELLEQIPATSPFFEQARRLRSQLSRPPPQQ